MGSLNKFEWLATTNVTFPLKSHRDSLRDPANRSALCAFTSFLTR